LSAPDPLNLSKSSLRNFFIRFSTFPKILGVNPKKRGRSSIGRFQKQMLFWFGHSNKKEHPILTKNEFGLIFKELVRDWVRIRSDFICFQREMLSRVKLSYFGGWW